MSALDPRHMPGLRVACPISEGRAATLSRDAVASLESGVAMSSREDIAAIQVRIAKAESERDGWQACGRQEKYLEAYSMVEVLELQLDRLRKNVCSHKRGVERH